MNLFLALAVACLAQKPDVPKPIDVRSHIHLAGVVVDSHNHPIEGVDVRWFWIESGRDPSDLEPGSLTDDQGRFSLDARLVRRPDRLQLRKDDALNPTFCLIHPQYGFKTVLVRPEWLDGVPARVRLSRAEELAVRVLDPSGDPVAGATVSIGGYPRRLLQEGLHIAQIPPPAKTDEQGRARLGGLDRSQVRGVMVDAPKFGRVAFGYTTSGASPDIDWPDELVLRLRPTGRIVGQLQANDPSSVQNVSILLTNFTDLASRLSHEPGLASQGVGSLKTDANGRFEAPAIHQGDWTILAEPPEASNLLTGLSRDTVTVGQTTEVSLRLRRGVRLRGRVLDRETHRPILGAHVELTTSPIRSLRSVDTDEQGHFTAVMPPAKLALEVEAGEFCLPAHRPRFAVEIPHDAREIDLPPIELVRGRRIAGLIVNQQGEPSGPGRVKALWVEHPGSPDARVQDSNEPIDDHGRFVLHAIPPDTPFYLLACTDEGATGPPLEIRPLDPSPRRLPFLPDRLEPKLGPGPIRHDLFFPSHDSLEMPVLTLPQDRPARLLRPFMIFIPDIEAWKFPLTLYGPAGIYRIDPIRPMVPDELCLPVFASQLKALDGRVLDIVGHPVADAEVFLLATGTLPGGLRYLDSPSAYEALDVRTDANGRFQTPPRLPAFLDLSVRIHGAGFNPTRTTSRLYAPTTPSFFDVRTERATPAAEKPVWDLVRQGLITNQGASIQ